MAPTIKWQRWDTANYDWFDKTAGAALPSLMDELSAWVAAVNGNASNSSRQLIIERDHNSSLQADYGGFVISAGAPGTADRGYFQTGVFSGSQRRFYLGDVYDNGNGLGGYGSVSNGGSDSNISFRTSGYEASWLITFDTADGEEYFSWGPYFNNNGDSYMDGFIIYKKTTGDWVLMANDGYYRQSFSYINTSDFTGWAHPNRSNTITYDVRYSSAYMFNRYMAAAETQASTSIIGEGLAWYAANPALMSNNISNSAQETGSRFILSDLGDGNNVYLLTLFHEGPSLLVDLRS